MHAIGNKAPLDQMFQDMGIAGTHSGNSPICVNARTKRRTERSFRSLVILHRNILGPTRNYVHAPRINHDRCKSNGPPLSRGSPYVVAAAVTVGAFAKKAEYENLAIVMDGRKIYRTPIDAI